MRNLCAILFILILLNSCTQSGKKNDSSDERLRNLKVLSSEIITEKPILPTIDLLIDFNGVGIKYGAGEVNPYVNVKKYNSQRAQELNLGVYIADFIYLASLNHQLNLSEYLSNIKYLLDELDIVGVFDDFTFKQYRAGLADSDSLYNLSIKTQNDMLDYLVINNREDEYIHIGIGGFVESFYLFLLPIETEMQFELVESEMENYKFVFKEYLNAAKNLETSAYLKETLNNLSPLFEEFGKLKVISVPQKTENLANGNIHISGGGEVEITYKEFVKIKQELIKVRTTFVSLN